MWNKCTQTIDWLLATGSRWLRAVVPPHCLVCGGAGDAESAPIDLCVRCKQSLPWMAGCCTHCALPLVQSADGCGACRDRSFAFDEAHAAFRYDAPLHQLLLRFKFHQDLACGRVLADLLGGDGCAAAWASNTDVVVPVPLSTARLRQRGYNQALLLAKAWATKHGVPCAPHALVRTMDRPAQSGLSKTQRRKNVRGVFAVECRDTFDEKHVLLVDDVMTTGATADEASKTLLRAGAASVRVLVVARVP